MSEQDRAFEEHMKATFGMSPQEVRVGYKIATGLHPDLLDALRGTALANDTDGLLVLTRLKPEHQAKLAYYIGEGLLPELAVSLMIAGELERLLDE